MKDAFYVSVHELHTGDDNSRRERNPKDTLPNDRLVG
jgi:hypothetical protein